MTVNTRKIPDYGEVMTLQEFVEQCKHHFFMNDDGSGYYAESTETMTDLVCRPSDVANGNITEGYNYVIWFNK